ncbi:hypothetical protein [Pseudoalteromonas ruthenica]|uniref:hypothetical protein n=1 Tax=Pseudoalteromonas ruthenica TaxID=151081 RepID=UPI00110B36DC|nr:hypothetical protein [Pseudoalteromonas ruthenica]TMO47258.1 hypothetical protein CWC24_08260 [Pseudoalteromonas ruthenica]TMO51431.1 hypothetical protein CWC23_07775 [Pseudoalteromonas ruthenica]
MDTICAFSSDSRELYKADIYRVLALPKNHIVHFRYKRKYVDDNLLNNPKKLKKQKVAIFFTHGNDLESSSDNAFQHFSVRWASITTTEFSEETDVLHIYMKLGDFCNVQIDTGNSDEKKPPTKFFSKLNCTERNEENNWQSRILVIKDYFPKMTFFHLKSIRNGWGNKRIRYKNGKKSCQFNLTHGDRYILKLAVSNPDASDTKIEISDSSEEITINCINPFETSIQFDDHDIPISVKTLQVFKQASLLEFKPSKKKSNEDGYEVLGEYATNIEFNLNLSLKRPLIFGGFSTMAFWAVLLARPISNSASWPSDCTLLIATLLFYVSSSSLFFWFNKK